MVYRKINLYICYTCFDTRETYFLKFSLYEIVARNEYNVRKTAASLAIIFRDGYHGGLELVLALVKYSQFMP